MTVRLFPIALTLIATAACFPAAASAQTASAPTAQPAADDTVRLTDEQRLAIIEGNTPERAAAARGELTGAERARRGIHGEVGVMVGSNGSHGIYGAAEIPLGKDGAAIVSFENTQYGYRRR
jgi:hypothetical protein